MNIRDETLMAYLDGELTAARRAEVDAALAADPRLAHRLEQYRSLRRRRGAAAGGGATVTDLRRVRAARAAEAKEAAASARRAGTPRPTWTWFEWGAVGTSVVIGAVIATLAMRAPGVSRIVTEDGQLVAQADLAEALSTQLVSAQPADSAVQIGASFESKAGDTCRTFTMKDHIVLGGLACRHGDAWQVQLVADGHGGYKGDGMPAAVTAAVGQQIKGEPFDAAGEAAARARGWQ